jgi:hypothetical protein
MSNRESLAKKQIWVLGAQCAEADRSIQWKDSYPNFADLDILIVNLTSLTIAICDSIDKRAHSQAQEMIWDKFCYGGTLIFITSSWHEHFPLPPIFASVVNNKGDDDLTIGSPADRSDIFELAPHMP